MTTVLATAGVALELALGGAVLNPWAHQLVDFDLGSGGNPSYPDASTALGPVDPVTGEGLGFPGPVTLFNPPFDTDEIVSLGNGGFLTIAFEQVVADRPGSDFIVFGNAGFFGAAPTFDVHTDPAMLFGSDGAGSTVEVSENGTDFFSVPGTVDGLFPTQPWIDAASTSPSNFRKPSPAGLTLGDFSGLDFPSAIALYEGSAGGKPFDIADAGVSAFQYVRITNQAASGDGNLEIDALVIVPEPATAILVVVGACFSMLKTRNRGT